MNSNSHTHKTEVEYCIICSDARLKFYFSAKDRNRRVNNNIFNINICPNCGMGYTAPMLDSEDLLMYYPKEYYDVEENVKIELNQKSRRSREIIIRRIQKYFKSGLMLDIGSGTGRLLKTAKAFGFQVEGIELSKESVDFGRRIWDLNIIEGDFESINFPTNHYDVVTMIHVFEHLRDPIKSLKKLYEIIRPGGLLVIAVPNFNSFQSYVFRSRWFHLDIPRHFYHYPASVIQNVLQREGFKIREINFFSYEHNVPGILGSIIRLSPPGESIIHKFFRKTIGVSFAYIIAMMESVLKKSGTIEIYATKE